MKKVAIILLLCISVFSLHAQEKQVFEAEIAGVVADSLTNETIPYATIKVMEQANPTQLVKALVSDVDGKFKLKLNKEGAYIFVFQSTGKKMLTKNQEITRETKKLDLGTILMSDENELKEVVVSAFRPLVQVDLDKISYSTEDDPDSKTSNVLDMLRKVPLVTVDVEDKIELKGSGSFKIYLDGKPSNLISNNPSQVLKSMPAITVKKIEVITDPGAKYDAEGVTGIINIVTNKQPMGGYTASVMTGVDTRGTYNIGAYLTAKYDKIGFTGNYNYMNFRSPEAPSYSYQENYLSSTNKYLTQNGTSQYKGNGQYGYGELSYEIDTLNLVSIGFNRYLGSAKPDVFYSVGMQDINYTPAYGYNQYMNSKNAWGGTDINANYQRTFKKKDELLTASYRLTMNPNDNESETKIEEVLNYHNSWQKQLTDAEMKEHTVQLDYTTPLGKVHTLEGGAKYIIRLNESNSGHTFYDFNTGEWKKVEDKTDDQFHHRQDIFSAYGGYNWKKGKYGFKAGLRLEETKLKVEYPLDNQHNFEADYFNLIPSVTASYLYKQAQTFRLGYNMRIQRPGIWYLNPYLNTSDPKYITQGNPDLDVEKSHNINFNYNRYNQKYNVNATLFYNFMNNSIQQVTTLEDITYKGVTYNDVSYTTYENIGDRNEAGGSLYLNLNLIKTLRIYSNLSLSYVDIRSNNNQGLVNYGFQERVSGGVQYGLPKDFSISINAGYSSPSFNMQGKSSGYSYSGIGVSKNLFEKKLTITVRANNIFNEYMKYSSTRQTDQFYYMSEFKYPVRYFGLNISYQFGKLNQQIKKVRRGITNEDTKQEDRSSGGQQGGSQ